MYATWRTRAAIRTSKMECAKEHKRNPRWVPPAMPFSEDRVREFVTIRAYNLEYADSEGLDEEFGPEPY